MNDRLEARYRTFATICAIVLLAAISASEAASTFRIEKLYSSPDGSMQFIELYDAYQRPDLASLHGLALTATSRYGVVKTIPLTDLPRPYSAGQSVLVATSELAQYWDSYNMGDYYPPEINVTLPVRFIPTDGGMIELTDGDRWTYQALPADSRSSLTRGSGIDIVMARDSRGHQYGQGEGVIWESAIEYHNARFDRYFLTGFAADIDALDSGRITGWARTGQSLVAFVRGLGNDNVVPICRYYYPTGDIGSHFLSASADECAAVGTRIPGAQLETNAAFYALVPDKITGVCPSNVTLGTGTFATTKPIYRLWDARGGFEHRYTSDHALKDQLVAGGWIAEGYGPDAVAMCSI